MVFTQDQVDPLDKLYGVDNDTGYVSIQMLKHSHEPGLCNREEAETVWLKSRDLHVQECVCIVMVRHGMADLNKER